MEAGVLLDNLIDDLNPEQEDSTELVLYEPDPVDLLLEENSVPAFVDDEDFPFFMTTVLFTLDCIVEWSKYKGKQEKSADKRLVYTNLAYQMENSHLLRRLLSNQPVFVEQPPRNYQLNWYELLEHGEDIVKEVEFTKFRSGTGFTQPLGDEPYVNLNKGSWSVLESDKEAARYTVAYEASDVKYILRKATVEEQNRLLHPREERTEKINAWILIREDKEDA